TVTGDIWFMAGSPSFEWAASGGELGAFGDCRGGRGCGVDAHFGKRGGGGLDHTAHDMLVHAADAADAETVHHGQLARIDDEALVLHQVVEARKDEAFMRRTEEGDD